MSEDTPASHEASREPYPGYLPAPPASARGRTSGLAIASLACSLVWGAWVGSLLGVVLGHVALRRVRRDPTVRGRGLAVAGLLLGYGALAVLALLVLSGAGGSG